VVANRHPGEWATPTTCRVAAREGQRAKEVAQVQELFGEPGGLGWVAVKAVLLFAVAVIGLRLGERRTLAQLSAFDFTVAVAIGSIIGRTVTAASTSFATGLSRWSRFW
jgi:hypothetical protein